MKKMLLLTVGIIWSLLLFSQSPNYFNYQSVVRNAEGELVTNQNVNFRFIIHEGSPTGTTVFSETQLIKSNAFGVCTMHVGQGDDATANLFDLDWGNNTFYLSIGVDITGATSFTDIGTVELLTVPYSFYSDKSAYSSTADLAIFSNKSDTAEVAKKLDEDVLYFTNTDTLFAVKDRDGNIVFAVFPDGAKVFVNESVKGNVGGFAVTGRNPGKGMSGDYLVVTSDSARIYINDIEADKGNVGGFAVTGRNPGKGPFDDYLRVTRDSTRVFVTESDIKGNVGGFAVTGRNPGKGDITTDYFNISGNTNVEVVNSEARILWYPLKEAFLVGRVLVESPDSVGINSVATGFESKAIGNYSQALGHSARAFGNNSTAIGDNANSIGLNSYAFGENAHAVAEGSYSIGTDSKATGLKSFSLGSSGKDNLGTDVGAPIASGDYSYAFGLGCSSGGFSSFALGIQAKAMGDYSFSFGKSTQALGSSTVAIGDASVAYDWYSVAIGEGATAGGEGAFALGQSTTTNADHSYCLATASTTDGYYSAAIGSYLSTKSSYEVVVGSYNDASVFPGDGSWNTADPIFVVGNGRFIFPSTTVRNNAFVVLKSGNVGINTNTPDKFLTVNGDARITGDLYYGTGTGIYTKPDYVFSEDYKKAYDVHYIENFIKKNGHLPWVTKASNEKGGVNITRMVFETLETVENQQLQIIELKKENDRLNAKKQQAEIDQLKQENAELKQQLNEILDLLQKE